MAYYSESVYAKVRVRFKWIYRSLITKWILVLCIVIIPVNIFAVVIVRQINTSYRRNREQSIASHLNSFVNWFKGDEAYLSESITNNLILGNFYELMRGDENESVLTAVRLKEALTKQKYNEEVLYACFVLDQVRGFANCFNIKHRDPAHCRQVEKALCEGVADWENGLIFMEVDEKCYLLRNYSFPFYGFGYLYDLEKMLKNCYEQCGEPEGTIYLTDGNHVFCGFSKQGFFTGKGQCTDSIRRESGLIAEYALGVGDYQVVCSVREAGVQAIYPLLLRLQYLFAGLSFAVIPLLYLYIKKQVIWPLEGICKGMEAVERQDLEHHVDETWGSYQMDYISQSFNHMVGRIKTLTIESYEKEIAKLQTEVVSAHLQVNQHMLLNSLNTVYSFILMKKYREAEDFIVLLMRYFQYALRKGASLVTVEEELEFVENYLQLQKMRFANQFTCVCSVELESKKIKIPQLLIYEFVENALKYGLSTKHQIEVLINIRRQEGRLILSVTNTGNGMSQEVRGKLEAGEIIEDLTGKHVGIWNTRKRLEYYYGADFELKITSTQGKGVHIFMNLPEKPMEEENNESHACR